MSAIQPTTISLSPPPDDDARGVALVTSLRRDLGFKMSWDLPTVLVLGIATAGLAPLFVLLLRIRRFARGEKFLLEHVYEWVQYDHGDVPQLRSATERLAARWPLMASGGLALGSVAVVLVIWHSTTSTGDVLTLWTTVWTKPDRMAYAYTFGLVCCYLFFVYGTLHAHVENVDQWLRAFKDLMSARGQRPIAWDRNVPASVAQDSFVFPSIAWVGVGFLLALSGCIWGMFMMLAAGAHRRYINEVSRDVRGQIADRIEQMRGRDAYATGR